MNRIMSRVKSQMKVVLLDALMSFGSSRVFGSALSSTLSFSNLTLPVIISASNDEVENSSHRRCSRCLLPGF